MNIRKQPRKNYPQKQIRFSFLRVFAAIGTVAAMLCVTPNIEAAAGDLDTTFNITGYTTTDFSGRTDHPYAVAMQADGKIVVVGYSFNGSNFDFAVARYNANGSLDTSFDTDGKVTTDFGGSSGDEAFAVAIQTDGKIVVAGFGSTSTENGLAVVRYNADGSLDTTFNMTGKVLTPVGAKAHGVTIQPDGKIVVAGDGFVLARYNTNGSLDTSFDGDGIVTTPMEGLTYGALGVAIQADGKIVAAGQSRIGVQNAAFALVRYNANGSLDTSFDTDGKVITDFDVNYDEANAVAIQSDGKIIAAGYTETTVSTDFALTRYNTNGSLDNSFDGDGKVTTPFSVNAGAIAVAIQSNGKIVAAGGCSTGSSVSSCIIRYNTDASLDASFGVGGKVSTSIGANSQFYGVTIQADGRIVAAGPTFVASNDNFAVARYAGDVVTRRTVFDFDGDGKTDISIFRPSVGEWWYVKSSNGGNYAAQFGNSTDKITPGDFTGDGKTDIAIWRPSSGEWFILRSEDASYYSFPFGANGDIPAPADFDGDGKTDAAIFRPSNATWYISRSSGGTTIQQFGANGDFPVVADYDGDGKSDIAIYRIALGEWWIQRSTAGLIAFQFGSSPDKPVPGDFTGDGKADVALFRPSTGEWFVLRSEDQSFYSFPFGTNGDVPAPGDYDGDGKFDATVFRPAASTWYAQRSTAGTLIQTFGQSGDVPVPNAFVP